MSISIFFENRRKKHLQNKICRLKKKSSFALKQSNKAKKNADSSKLLIDSNASLLNDASHAYAAACSAAYLENIAYYSDKLFMYEWFVRYYYKRHTSIEHKIAVLEDELKNL